LSEKPTLPEDVKKKIEELKKRLWDLRSRIERWGMLKISDVAELNAVYKEIGSIARELAKLNPHPAVHGEAVSLMHEAYGLLFRIDQLRQRVRK
jgi:predicted  nucleic acid-binding Zn-ribbon protein